MIPRSPVVNKRIIDSCTLTIVSITAEETYTEKPSKLLETAAIAIGSVLNGLNANPSVGKKTGNDWNNTVSAVNMPPTHINLITSIFFKWIPLLLVISFLLHFGKYLSENNA